MCETCTASWKLASSLVFPLSAVVRVSQEPLYIAVPVLGIACIFQVILEDYGGDCSEPSSSQDLRDSR